MRCSQTPEVLWKLLFVRLLKERRKLFILKMTLENVVLHIDDELYLYSTVSVYLRMGKEELFTGYFNKDLFWVFLQYCIIIFKEG